MFCKRKQDDCDDKLDSHGRIQWGHIESLDEGSIHESGGIGNKFYTHTPYIWNLHANPQTMLSIPYIRNRRLYIFMIEDRIHVEHLHEIN